MPVLTKVHFFLLLRFKSLISGQWTVLRHNKELLLIFTITRIINIKKRSPPKNPTNQLTEYTDIHELRALAGVSLCAYWVLMPCGKIFHR